MTTLLPTTGTARRPAIRPVPPLVAVIVLLGFTGCASTLPIVRKESYDFKTTALFLDRCADARDEHKSELVFRQPELKLYAKAAASDVPAPQADAPPPCHVPDLQAMVESFLSIREADADLGIRGDTVDDVRRKGFSIYLDGQGKIRRPNTRALYGNEALQAAGMAISPPPLQRPEEIKAYTEFMAKLYGEEYFEKDVLRVTDRVCLNTRESLELGDERTFAIVWRDGHVFKRVIKGGPINNPRRERALLLCPGDMIGGTLNDGVRAIVR